MTPRCMIHAQRSRSEGVKLEKFSTHEPHAICFCISVFLRSAALRAVAAFFGFRFFGWTIDSTL